MPHPKPVTDLAVTFIGVGNMGEAVLAGSLRGGLAADGVRVTTHRPENAERVASTHGVTGGTDNVAAVAGADLVVVGVEPAQVPDVLREVAGHLADDAVVVSLAGGVGVADLQAELPEPTAVVRALPNTPAAVGRGMVGLTPGPHCSPEQLDTVRAFFGLSGEVVVVPEEHQRALGSLSGSGPAHVFYVVDAMIEAGVTMGLSRDLARRLVVETVIGAGELLKETGGHPAVLREKVSSPGGSTIAAMGELDDRAVRAAFVSALTGRFRG